MKIFTVLDLLQLDLKEHDALNLKCLAGRPGLAREVMVPDLDRPGLALSGFYDNFAYQRIQIFGKGENAYLSQMEQDGKTETLNKIFSYKMPCCIFTHGLKPTPTFFELANKNQCPILQTNLTSSEFSARIIRVLSNIFAPSETVHGVLVEVFGIGVLIKGESGVGKSEAALSLIERGHRMVADDVVQIKCVGGNFLMGKGFNTINSHHMEIRGLGIINITYLFGMGAVREEKRIQLIVELEEWDANKDYSRIDSTENTVAVLGVKLPVVYIPIKPGRNVPLSIEIAAMNERLKNK